MSVMLASVRAPVAPLWREATTKIFAGLLRASSVVAGPSTSATDVIQTALKPRESVPHFFKQWKLNCALLLDNKELSPLAQRIPTPYSSFASSSSSASSPSSSLLIDHDNVESATLEGMTIEVADDLSSGFMWSSVLKKRRRKMNRHKYKKWRKKMRYKLRALGK